MGRLLLFETALLIQQASLKNICKALWTFERGCLALIQPIRSNPNAATSVHCWGAGAGHPFLVLLQCCFLSDCKIPTFQRWGKEDYSLHHLLAVEKGKRAIRGDKTVFSKSLEVESAWNPSRFSYSLPQSELDWTESAVWETAQVALWGDSYL